MLQLHSLAYPITALGPGRRLALWVAGCPLRCHGCITPQLQAADSGKAIALERLLQHLLKLPTPLDGISLTGGEPFAQAEPLAALLSALKAARNHWNVLVFSGYPLAHLQAQAAAQKLLAQTDILVAGPFLPEQQRAHPLAASANQQVHYLSTIGKSLHSACAALPPNQANLALGQQGTHLLVGLVTTEKRLEIHQHNGIRVA